MARRPIEVHWYANGTAFKRVYYASNLLEARIQLERALSPLPSDYRFLKWYMPELDDSRKPEPNSTRRHTGAKKTVA